MLPVGPLMKEHRTIERMAALVGKQGEAAERGEVDVQFVFQAVDFFRTYADEAHHGKEEEILFRDLQEKPLSAEHRAIMQDLISEHVYARKIVGSLVNATERHLKRDADAVREVADKMRELAQLYPAHIEKEDKHFFLPSMEYFTDEEKQAMLEEIAEFDRRIIHEHYRKMIDALEQR